VTVGDAGVESGLPRALVAALEGTVVRPSWVAVGLAALVVPLAPDLPPVVQFAPFVVSLVVFGLPHGAVDHLAPARTADVGLVRSVAIVAVVYALLGGAYALGWFLAPAAAFVGFIALTWFHWGQGDVYAVLAFLGGEHLPTRAERTLALVVRGGLPMAVPLLSHPAEYRRVAAAVVRLFDPTAGGAVAALDPYFTPAARLAVAGTMVAATLASVGLGAWRVRRGAAARGWRRDAGEVALLWVYFWLVPPILAVGLYFTLWHATRHVARLIAVDDVAAGALAEGDTAGALRRFARDATPNTLGALAVFGGLYAVVPATPAGRDGLLGLYLVGIAVLTLPHVAIVTWMDAVQGVYSH
jgi:Brp/Blh family beta-carotene 15,15'-monooxygenase